MDAVKVFKSQLQTIVATNRTAHKAQFEEAFAGFRKACIDALELNLAAFKSGKATRVFINEQPPEDHTKDYDRVIKMLEMSVEDNIELSASAFEQYVLDEWHWKEAWAASNFKYMK